MINVKEIVDEAYRQETRTEKTRAYIGASVIGGPCEAAIAFSLRGYPESEPDPRIKRIFRDGHRIEDTVVSDLKKAGLHIMEVDPMTKQQWTYTAYQGHVIGHADGLLESGGETMLVEIKSMNDSKFNDMTKKGLKFAHRMYYGQVQFMMGLSKIEKCLFVVYNKNNSDYYSEIVDFDEFEFASLRVKAETALRGKARKISEDEADWRCRGCFKFDACWHGLEPKEKTKRTCANARPCQNGEWKCEKGCGETCTDWKRYEPLPRASIT